jgi:hypothetical protein
MAVISCENKVSPEKSKGLFSGEIYSADTGEPVYPVYVFEDDSLLSTVYQNHHYSIELNQGYHEILFSAVGYLDTLISVDINGHLMIEIKLTGNAETGKVYGEFQDLLLWQQRMAEDKDMENWTEQQIRDGVTGATIQEKNSNQEFQQAQIFIGDSLLGYADVFGQYWLKIQFGTYPLTGKSQGYTTKMKIVKVLPDSNIFNNFYLTPL